MFKFHWTRKPNFKRISQNIYHDYWQDSGFKLRDKLLEREVIFFNWIKPDSKILNIGCGNSRLLLELKQKKNCQVFGIDIESSVIKCLKDNKVDGLVTDVTANSFEIDDSYDYIIMSEILEHIDMPEKLIQKIKLQTKYLILSIPNSAFYRYRLSLMFKGRFFTQWVNHPAEHLRFWSHKDFLDWLDALDLKIIKFEPSNGFDLIIKFKNIWPNLFGHQICYLAKNNL